MITWILQDFLTLYLLINNIHELKVITFERSPLILTNTVCKSEMKNILLQRGSQDFYNTLTHAKKVLMHFVNM